MADFLARAQKNVVRLQAASDHNFSKRALCKFCEGFLIDVSTQKHDSEFGFGWFHDEYPHFPLRLEAKRTEIALDKAAKDMTKAWFWNVYIGLLEQTTYDHLAMFAPIVKGGLYVVHNHLSLAAAPGFSRIVHTGHNETGVIVESVDAFVAALKKAGVTP